MSAFSLQMIGSGFIYLLASVLIIGAWSKRGRGVLLVWAGMFLYFAATLRILTTLNVLTPGEGMITNGLASLIPSVGALYTIWRNK